MDWNYLCRGCWEHVEWSRVWERVPLAAEPPAKEAKVPCSVALWWYAGFCQARCPLRYLPLSARGIYKLGPFCDRVTIRMWTAVDQIRALLYPSGRLKGLVVSSAGNVLVTWAAAHIQL